MTAFLDTKILIRHLTGDPPAMAARATAQLASADDLHVVDVVVAEVVYLLEAFYDVERSEVAQAFRSIVGRSIVVDDADLVLRAVDLQERERFDLADAYVVASAERSGAGDVTSFDRALDRVRSIHRVERPSSAPLVQVSGAARRQRVAIQDPSVADAFGVASGLATGRPEHRTFWADAQRIAGGSLQAAMSRRPTRCLWPKVARPSVGQYLVQRRAAPSTMTGMSSPQRYVVSSSGQMSLPASARHRWALDEGGPVDVIDLGFGVLTVPAGQARRLLGDLLSREDHAAFVRELEGDSDLATT